MKVIFDTNIYISWIRDSEYSYLMLNQNTQKYLSSIVLMELWAGTKTKDSVRLIEKLQRPYLKSGRIITLSINHYIQIGQIISDLPSKYKSKINISGFINDISIGLNAVTIGAVLFTENKSDFLIINEYIKTLKVEFI
ncbi:MAG: hypothetical protein V1874_14870 [Spirochaetota bacterium]